MARNRRSPRTQPTADENSMLASWERELLGLPQLPGQKPKQRTRAEIRQWDRRALRLSGRTAKAQATRKRTPKTALKPKTAEAADRARRLAESHRKGKYTRDFKPRKSRRAIKRELYGNRPEEG